MTYQWRIKGAPGELLRSLGWRWAGPPPAGKVRRARGVRWRIGKFLLAVTDDRAWTLPHQSSTVRVLRRYLGRQEREYELTETSNQDRDPASELRP